MNEAWTVTDLSKRRQLASRLDLKIGAGKGPAARPRVVGSSLRVRPPRWPSG